MYQIDSTNLLRMSTNGQYSKGIDSSRTLLQRLQLLARSPLLIAGGGGGGGTWSNAQFSHGEPGKSFHNPFLYYSNLRNDATNDQTHAFAGTWNHTMRSPSLPVDGSPLVRLHFDLDLLESPAARLNITPNRLQQIAAESNQSASLFSGRICDDKRSTSGSIYGGFGGGSGSCLFGGGGAGYQPGFGRGKFGGTGGSSFFDSNRARFPAYSSDAWATLDNDHHPQHQLYSNAASPAPDVGHRQQLTKTQRMWPPQDNGFVLIVPQIENCCDRRYPCVFLNGELNRNPVQTMCVCSANHFERSTCVRPGSCKSNRLFQTTQIKNMHLKTFDTISQCNTCLLDSQ